MVIIELNPREIELLLQYVRSAHEDGRRLRVAVDEGTFKAKVGESVWTPPLGTVQS